MACTGSGSTSPDACSPAASSATRCGRWSRQTGSAKVLIPAAGRHGRRHRLRRRRHHGVDGLPVGKVYIRKPNGKTIEVANGMAGPNSLAFGKDGRLFVSEVFLGDALYEIDLKGVKAAAQDRTADKLGGLNGFEIRTTASSMARCGSRARSSRSTSRPARRGDRRGLQDPGRRQHRSAERDNLYVVDTGTGGCGGQPRPARPRSWSRAEARPRQSRLRFARPPVRHLDDRQRHLLVDKQTGAAKHRRGQARDPADIAVVSESGKDTVHVADVFSYRTVDGQTARSATCSRACDGDTHAYPMRHLGRPQDVLLSSWFSNTVEKVDRKTGKLWRCCATSRRRSTRSSSATAASRRRARQQVAGPRQRRTRQGPHRGAWRPRRAGRPRRGIRRRSLSDRSLRRPGVEGGKPTARRP